jgi:acetyl esterase/lipase
VQRSHRILGWAAVAEGALLAVTCGLPVLGAFVPELGWLGVLGATVVPVFPLWFVVLACVSALPSLLALRLGFVGVGSAFTAVSALSLAGTMVILGSLLQVAAANGANVDLLQSLTFTSLSDARPDATMVYTTRGNRPLDIDVYEPTHIPADGAAPVMLYVHGGGWFQGDRASGSTDLRWFADRGYVVVSPDYSLATRSDHVWDVVPGEIACAMVWTANHADSMHADMRRFVMAGDSAGGNLAINAAYAANEDRAESSCGGTVPHVRLAIAGSPILDPVSTWNNRTVQGDAARSLLLNYVGGSPEQYPDRYRAISSFTYLNPIGPATLIINGASDHVVPHQQSVDFVRDARAAGVDATLVVIPFADHSFDLTFGAIGHQIKLSVFDRFLRVREGPPST